MCRMFAVRATHVTYAANELVTATHSLRCQSKCDQTGRDHSDGWGVADYRSGLVRVTRAESAAHLDSEFETACAMARSKTILTHVRRASKGITKLANAHPFVHGKWIFAHNGTLTSLETLRPGMTKEVPARFRRRIHGETDSELIFYWLLRRLEDAKAIQGNQCRSLAKMRQTLASGVLELDRRNSAAEADFRQSKQAKLNFLVTNGTVLAGTRFRNTLFSFQEETRRSLGKPFRSIAIASEPPDSRRWQEIPDRSVFSISSEVNWTLQPIDEGLATSLARSQ